MTIILIVVALMIGFAYGAFASAQIFYPILVTLPLFSRLKRQGAATDIPWSQVIVPPAIGFAFFLLLLFILPMFVGSYSTAFFIGAAVSGLVVLSKAGSNQNKIEALENNAKYLIADGSGDGDKEDLPQEDLDGPALLVVLTRLSRVQNQILATHDWVFKQKLGEEHNYETLADGMTSAIKALNILLGILDDKEQFGPSDAHDVALVRRYVAALKHSTGLFHKVLVGLDKKSQGKSYSVLTYQNDLKAYKHAQEEFSKHGTQVNDIYDRLTAQRNAHETPLDEVPAEDASTMPDDLSVYYAEAVTIAHRTGKVSNSLLTRKLEISQEQAAEIINLLEANGVIGPVDSHHLHDVLAVEESKG